MDHPAARRPAVRRDAAGTIEIGRDWESLTERLIREAAERGEFEQRRAAGRRLPVDDDSGAGEMALAYRVLRNAGAAPPWIEADKRARQLRDDRDRLLARAHGASSATAASLRRQLARIVAEHNAAVAQLNAEAPTARQQRVLMVPARELEALEGTIKALEGAIGVDPVTGPSRA